MRLEEAVPSPAVVAELVVVLRLETENITKVHTIVIKVSTKQVHGRGSSYSLAVSVSHSDTVYGTACVGIVFETQLNCNS